MKRLKKPQWAPAVCGLALSLAAITATARPYASALRNDSGVISFTLNESAEDVQVVFNGGTSTNFMGALDKGVHTFNLGSNTSYAIHVSKNGGQGYQHSQNGTNAIVSQISSTNNSLVSFYSPRGVAINQNPASPYFGRVYVGNGLGGTAAATGRFTDIGVFMLNPDETSAHNPGEQDTALNPGFRLAGAGSSPWELKVATDDQLYVADWSDGFGNLLVANQDVTQLSSVLKDLSVTSAVFPITTNNTHGSITAMHVEGSLANNNLVAYTIDEDMQSDKSSTNKTQLNSLWRYDIGGSLPHLGEATRVFTPGEIPNTGIRTAAQTMALARGTNGYFYVTNFRSEGTDTSGLIVLDSTGAVLWNSRATSISLIGGNRDILRLAYKVAVTRDQKYVAVATSHNIVWIIPLVNGIPDLTQRLILPAFGPLNVLGSTNMRGIAFDAANNLYAVNTRDEVLRVFAPGGTATTVTSSDGTFKTLITLPQVSVTSTTASTTEGSAAGQFTLNRTGDTSGSLTVSVTITGTASNGTDYTTIATNANFGAGVSSININVTPINDVVPELTETVTLTIGASDTYGVASPSTATVSILDNEATQVSITATQPTLLESYAFSKGIYQVTRLGSVNSALTVNLTYSGATIGADFNGPTTVALASGVATASFNVTPINNNTYAGDKSITATLASGNDYIVATPTSATVTLVDDENLTGTTLFEDNFQTDSSANWTLRTAEADTSAEFGWDYSTYGIPVAPATTDSTTKGLRLRVNVTAGDLNAAVTASPNGQNLTGDYRMKFDMWLNYNGPMLGGGDGSTYGFVTGLGTAGTAAQVPKGVADGVMFKTTNDGGDGNADGDYSVYTNGVLVADGSGAYPAGTALGARNNTAPYYSIWGGNPAPAAQLASHSEQTGNSLVGVLGMSWHTVVITKIGEVVTWDVDGVNIASVTNTAGASFPTTGKVFVGWYDPYAGVSPELCFAVIDNLKVETVPSITPEAPVLNYSRTGNSITLTWTGSATLQQASALTGSPSDWSAVAGSSGVTFSTSSGTKFYRLVQ